MYNNGKTRALRPSRVVRYIQENKCLARLRPPRGWRKEWFLLSLLLLLLLLLFNSTSSGVFSLRTEKNTTTITAFPASGCSCVARRADIIYLSRRIRCAENVKLRFNKHGRYPKIIYKHLYCYARRVGTYYNNITYTYTVL